MSEGILRPLTPKASPRRHPTPGVGKVLEQAPIDGRVVQPDGP
jgi:hypothetical protein